MDPETTMDPAELTPVQKPDDLQPELEESSYFMSTVNLDVRRLTDWSIWLAFMPNWNTS